MAARRTDDILCFEVGSGDQTPWLGSRRDLDADWNALRDLERQRVIQIDVNDDRVTIRGATRVGLVMLPSGRRLIVRSKIPGVMLLEWLEYLGDFPRLTTWLAAAGISTGTDWPECITRLFLYALEQVTRRHLRRDYVTVRTNAPEIRGRILTSMLAQGLHRLPSVPQLQRQRSFNMPYNIALAMALDRISFHLTGDPELRKRVAVLREQWAAIDRRWSAPLPVLNAAQSAVPPGYREALQLARLILLGASIDSEAPSGGQAFTLSLASVWERAVRRLCDEVASEHGWRRTGRDQRTRRWDDPTGRDDRKRWMTADVILERPRERWILDAKYKCDFGNESRNDRFQIGAYALAFDCGRASLVYPSTTGGFAFRRLLVTTIHDRQVQLDSMELPLSAGPAACRSAFASMISTG